MQTGIKRRAGLDWRVISLVYKILWIIASTLQGSDISALACTHSTLYPKLRLALIKYNIRHQNSSALNWAAKTNNRAIAKTLLPYQADVDAMVDDFSPLMTAAKYGSDLVTSLLLRKREPRVNTRNANGLCALWYGVENGSFAVVNRLLQHPRVKIDLPNCQGQTVLWLAVYRGNREFASLLLSRGANPDIKDVGGFSPWIEACISNKNSVKDLLLDFIFAEHNGNCDLVPSPDSMAKQMRENPKRPKHYIFGRLSLELKFEIFSYLSFDELLNVRLLYLQPWIFFHGRTGEVGFSWVRKLIFFFLDITDTLDWYLIFFGTRASLAAGTLPLINRKRIRQLLEPIAALVGLEAVHKNGPYGSAAHPAQRQSGYYQVIDDESAEKSSRLIEVAGFFSGQLASVGTDSPLGEGCRVIYHRTQSLVPPSQQYRQRIGISTIQFAARSFISGINLSRPGNAVSSTVESDITIQLSRRG
ncbi:hypothetical protein N7453_010335 [Penicillium expansum]|nr:hypothetical protein N7453_010335 [Penicillium expansum]